MDTRETRGSARESSAGSFAPWRLKGIGALRFVLGLVWGVDAWFKWQPDFVNNFTNYLSDAQAHEGQPAFIKG